MLIQIIRHNHISTHAPTRGATVSRITARNNRSNFYSRPYARGDVLSFAGPILALLNFYSRPYARGDSECA